jgi:hypothetical protein
MSTFGSLVSDERFVLAFYGLASSPRASEGFFFAVSRWFSELGYSPDKLGVIGEGHSGKIGDYRRSSSKLEKTGFSDVKAFDICASKPGARVPGMEYFASASFSHAGDDGGYAIVAVPSSLPSRTDWLPIAQEIIQSVRPAYGIGFKRELSLGPVKYALGVCQGLGVGLTGEAYEEARNISRWCDIGMVKQVYRDGLLRDVYSWNFLTQPQLAKSVGSTTLELWIEQDGRRGVIALLSEGVSLWEVDEAHIPSIRQILHQAGVIFDWRRYS